MAQVTGVWGWALKSEPNVLGSNVKDDLGATRLVGEVGAGTAVRGGSMCLPRRSTHAQGLREALDKGRLSLACVAACHLCFTGTLTLLQEGLYTLLDPV